MSKLYTCAACGYRVFTEPAGSLQRCPVCKWVDDHIQLALPFLRQGMNHASLADYQSYLAQAREAFGETQPAGFEKDPNWMAVPPWREEGTVVTAIRKRLSPPPGQTPIPDGWPEQRLSRLIEQRHVASLLWMRKDTDPSIASRAEEGLRSILTGLSAKEAVRLDEGVRQRFGDYRGEWPADLLADDMPADVRAALRASHPNGRIRESAVNTLNGMSTGFELPFLLLRVNDWVLPVRTAALEAIISRLHAGYANHLVRQLGLLAWLESVQRTDNRAWVGEARTILQTVPFRPALEAGLDSPDRLVRREAFKLLLAAPEVSLPDLAHRGFRSRDAVLCLRAARTVATRADNPEFRELLLGMRRFHLAPVRRLAVEALLAGDDAASFRDEALADPNPAVRALGQAHAKKASLDLGSWYAARLAGSEGRRLTAVIAGLGETGAKERAGLVAGYLSHRLPSVRRAALGALSAMSDDAIVSAALRALSDESGSVSRRALSILRRRPSAVDASQVWNIVESDAPLHAKRNSLRVLASLAKWRSVPYLVRAACSDHPVLADIGLELLYAWLQRFNSSFTSPSAEQLASLRAALALGEARLPKGMTQHLRFLADSAA